MKKTYIKPSVKAVKLTMNCAMLAGSLRKNSDTVTNENDILSRRNSIWDDEEDDY